MAKFLRVSLPALSVGPPHQRQRAPKVLEVSPDEAERLVAEEGGRIVSDDRSTSKTGDQADKPKEETQKAAKKSGKKG